MSNNKEKESELKESELKEINKELKEVNRIIRKTKLDVELIDEIEEDEVDIEETINEEDDNTSDSTIEKYEGSNLDDFESEDDCEESNLDDFESEDDCEESNLDDFENEEDYEEYKDCIDDTDFEEGSDDEPEDDDTIQEIGECEKFEPKKGPSSEVGFKLISKEEYIGLKKSENVFMEHNKSKTKKTILTSIVAIVILVIGLFIYKDKFISNDKYAFKFGDVKIERSITEKLKDNFSSEEELAYFVMDTLSYSGMAKEEGMTVTEEEIEKYAKEFSVYKEEIALSYKILETYAQKTENLKEEELKKLYEENKDLYVKSGDVKFIALDSETYIPADYKLTKEEVSKYEVNEEKIENLIGSGIYPTEIVIEKPLLFEYANDENGNLIYKYFYILEKNITDYYSFEDSIDYIKSQYDRTNGYASLVYKNQASQENLTIEYYN